MTNEQQIIYWNEVAGPKWVGLGDAMERRLTAINDLLLGALQPRPGETILDIGCGTGVTTLPLAEAVGGTGHVTGIDVSTPMLDAAAARRAGLGNVTLIQADAQNFDFGGGRFDALTSRFGVMFFADPVAAFVNLRRALRPSGRLCFVCWAGLDENPHWKIPFDLAVARLGLPASKPPHAAGPMGLSDISYLQGILQTAGFTDATVTRIPVSIAGDSLQAEARIACVMGPAGALLNEKQADEALRGQLRREVAAAIEPFMSAQGMRLPATVLLVQAQI